jgi:hypothetical protein
MSVENKTIIIVGMTQEVFEDHFPLPNDDIVDDFTDDFFIDSDSWCGGQIFYANYIDELNEGEWHVLDEILNASQRLAAIKKYREKMKKYGYNIPEYLINFFIVSQVF